MRSKLLNDISVTLQQSSDSAMTARIAKKLLTELMTEYESLWTKLSEVCIQVKSTGHNNDCLFCGFKDRIVGEAFDLEKKEE